jgi:glycosyltransferase involved in cell wall biosynthesis
MGRKRILIVSRSFYPENAPRSFRTTELAKELSRQGHDVTVYIPAKGNDYTSFGIEHGLKIKNLGDPKWKAIDLKGGKIEQLVRRAISRALKLLFEWPDIQLIFKVSKTLQNEQGYDLLISIAVPHPIHWGVARIWNKKKNIAKIWVADCGDSYMFARLDTFKKMFYFKYFEKSFCRKCSFISVPFDAMHTQFYREFRSKIITIPQGFDLTEIKRFNKPIQNEKTTFMFAGSIIPGFRDLTLFLDFLKNYSNNFLFIAYANEQEWFEKYKNDLKNRIEIRGYIDRLTLIYEMSKVDFLVNVDTIMDSKSNIEAVPSKLIDYALSGRPILNINSNNLDIEKVKAFLSGDYSKARFIDISKYDITLVAKKFTSLHATD